MLTLMTLMTQQTDRMQALVADGRALSAGRHRIVIEGGAGAEIAASRCRRRSAWWAYS